MHQLTGKKQYLLLLITVIGLAFRLWGIKQDLPYNYYGDENYLVYNALKFGTGDLNPHWFVWPTFFPYLLFLCFGIFYMAGLVLGGFKTAGDFIYLYLKDPSMFFMIARLSSALFGAATVTLVYALGKKAYGKKTGLLAAGIFSILPLAVEYSHYAVADTPLVFMITLSFIFIMNVHLCGKPKDYILSGLLIGMAMGTKYPAVILGMPLFLAHSLRAQERRLSARWLILSLGFIFLGFFMVCPFAILDFNNFLFCVKGQLLCARIGWFGWEKTSPYIYHLFHNLREGVGGNALFIPALIGALYAAAKRRNSDILLLSFALTYFLLIGMDKNIYSRFMLPVLPFLAIFSARLMLDLWQAFSAKKIYRALLICLGLFTFIIRVAGR